MKVNYISEKIILAICFSVILYCFYLILTNDKFFNNDELKHFFDDQMTQTETERIA
jgi:hypothetical protein